MAAQSGNFEAGLWRGLEISRQRHNMRPMKTRELQTVVPSMPASDGAGVKLRRSIGGAPGLRHDPFLMLDEFFSDDPDDYLAGFPAHPHRGFETVTYMLDGHMQHKDNHGNTGDLGPGDVQWMSAASGIIHSEMPQQSEGRMRGFQLWLNLPAKEKMRPAAYRDISSKEIPVLSFENGEVKLIAGKLKDKTAPINGGSTDPYYFDVHLAPGAVFEAPLPADMADLLEIARQAHGEPGSRGGAPGASGKGGWR